MEAPIAELLLDDKLIQEYASQHNRRLMDFVTQPTVMRDLLAFVTVDPQPSDPAERIHRLPQLACDFLCLDVTPTHKVIVNNPVFLDELFNAFSKTYIVNPNIPVYACRVLAAMMKKNVVEVFTYMKKGGVRVMDAMLSYLHLPPMLDALLRFIKVEELGSVEVIVSFLREVDLVQRLVSLLRPDKPESMHTAVATCLLEITMDSVQMGTPAPLLEDLHNPRVVSALLSCVLSDSLSCLHCALNVLTELMNLERFLFEVSYQDQHGKEGSADPESKAADGSEANLPGSTQAAPPQKHSPRRPSNARRSVVVGLSTRHAPSMMGVILARLEELSTILKKDPPPLHPTRPRPPLGAQRLKIVQFLNAVVHTGYEKVGIMFLRTSLMSICLDLFFTYAHNNFLHTTLCNMVHVLLAGSTEQKVALCVDAKLCNRLVDAARQNEEEYDDYWGKRRGYMGHITIMSNDILKSAHEDHVFAQYVSDPESEWHVYCKTALMYVNQIEGQPLGFDVPTRTQDELSDVFDVEGLAPVRQKNMDELTCFEGTIFSPQSPATTSPRPGSPSRSGDSGIEPVLLDKDKLSQYNIMM